MIRPAWSGAAGQDRAGHGPACLAASRLVLGSWIKINPNLATTLRNFHQRSDAHEPKPEPEPKPELLTSWQKEAGPIIKNRLGCWGVFSPRGFRTSSTISHRKSRRRQKCHLFMTLTFRAGTTRQCRSQGTEGIFERRDRK